MRSNEFKIRRNAHWLLRLTALELHKPMVFLMDFG